MATLMNSQVVFGFELINGSVHRLGFTTPQNGKVKTYDTVVEAKYADRTPAILNEMANTIITCEKNGIKSVSFVVPEDIAIRHYEMYRIAKDLGENYSAEELENQLIKEWMNAEWAEAIHTYIKAVDEHTADLDINVVKKSAINYFELKGGDSESLAQLVGTEVQIINGVEVSTGAICEFGSLNGKFPLSVTTANANNNSGTNERGVVRFWLKKSNTGIRSFVNKFILSVLNERSVLNVDKVEVEKATF